MNNVDIEARAVLQEVQGQPEEIQRIFVYVVCQTMQQTGLLQLIGAFENPGMGSTLIYRNPDTGEIFEILKPTFSDDDEQAMKAHIKELLQENAQAV